MPPCYGGKRQHDKLSVALLHVRSIPIAALEVLLMLLPLGIYIERESIQTAYRLKLIGRINQVGQDHLEIIGRLIKEDSVFLAPPNKIEPINFFGRKFRHYCHQIE
jgi:hypothetical protein